MSVSRNKRKRRKAFIVNATRWGRVAGKPGCPYCGVPMRLKSTPRYDDTATQDHILPQAWGGTNERHNIKVVCHLCNETRGVLNHCIGAMACARACIGRRSTRETVAWWRDRMLAKAAA